MLLRLNACCYAVKNEEQICSELSICSPRQFYCIMTTLNRLSKIEFEGGNWKRALNVKKMNVNICLIHPADVIQNDVSLRNILIMNLFKIFSKK